MYKILYDNNNKGLFAFFTHIFSNVDKFQSLIHGTYGDFKSSIGAI